MAKKNAEDKPKDQHRSNRMVRLRLKAHEMMMELAQENQRPMARELNLAVVAWLRSKGKTIPPELE
jgi:hypothetical protein